MEQSVHHLQAFFSVQRLGGDAQLLEVVEDVDLDALQPRLCRSQGRGLNAEGQILGLNQTVVALGKLAAEERLVFFRDAVERISAKRDGNAVSVGFFRRSHIHKGKLELDGRIKVVQEIAPAVKDRGFVLVLIELIVDVLKLNCFCVVIRADAADAVGEHPFKGDAVLRGLSALVLPLCFGDSRFNLFSVATGECVLV